MEGCFGGVCGRCWGGKKIILGALLILWAYYWTNIDWRIFFGWVLVVVGALHIIKPYCPHCEVPMMKRKKR